MAGKRTGRATGIVIGSERVAEVHVTTTVEHGAHPVAGISVTGWFDDEVLESVVNAARLVDLSERAKRQGLNAEVDIPRLSGPITGHSLGLAIAVSMLCALERKRPRADTVFLAGVTPTGIVGVDDIEYKLQVAQRYGYRRAVMAPTQRVFDRPPGIEGIRVQSLSGLLSTSVLEPVPAD